MMDEVASNASTEAVTAVGAKETPDDASVLTQESTAVVPASAPSSDSTGKLSFWRRIAPARAGRRGPELGEALSAQVEALAAQLAAAEVAITSRLEATERRIDEVWEVEEELSILREAERKLADLEKSQKALASSVKTTNSLLGVVAALVVASAAVVGAIAAGVLVF